MNPGEKDRGILKKACIAVERLDGLALLRLQSEDGTNRLSRECVLDLTRTVEDLAVEHPALVITGNGRFFSAGADLQEIALLDASSAYKFSEMGQALMQAIADFPAPVCAAISGFCMGGGLDLALACDARVASPNAVLGHRGAALGLITGWGGTQRLPRVVGKGRALALFVAAEKVSAAEAFEIGLVDAVAADAVAGALRWVRSRFVP